MTKEIIIFGVGGNCIDILDTINDINLQSKTPTLKCIGFLDDKKEFLQKIIHGVKVLGPLETASDYSNAYFVNGIVTSKSFFKRDIITAKANIPLAKFATIIHPSASISTMASLGLGTVVFQNVTITSNVTIGNHVVILPQTIVSHDVVIEDYTCITGGVCISGGVKIGKCCYVGTGSMIRENIEIGTGSLVGMGSVVLKDVPQNSVVVGHPAQFLRNVQ